VLVTARKFEELDTSPFGFVLESPVPIDKRPRVLAAVTPAAASEPTPAGADAALEGSLAAEG